ncbi:putative glycerophosphodiester phosphodiesterase, protein kinase RLK-Pelle-LRK10L-2 family [Rosa chinensis]|uniref:Putative glycerophosphodiester phosphodiesterase, protein kinase RLK-Pelle-LRK10L-2 family n=1 Tax=Rosa chinensis TaxID=74649 RepID=A0A2P6SB40_ROSCH|nr:putative glycerophosphodiester phosphodiesterase, protein kinase RLK-Pelle-LRK10L-2 family [Rosa chinensis]
MLMSMAFFKVCHNACTESECGDHDDHRLAIHVPVNRARCRGGYFQQQSDKTVVEQKQMLVKFFVKHIDYKHQKIQVHTPDDCFLLKQLETPSMKPMFSPLNFSEYQPYQCISLFNCPTANYPHMQVPCLSDLVYKNIYAVSSEVQAPQYCTKMYDLINPYGPMHPGNYFWYPDNYFLYPDNYFRWSTPNCTECEAKRKKCQLKINGTESEIECVHFSKPSATVTTIILLILVTVFYRSDKKERENQLKIEKFLEDYKALKPSRYSYADIKRITNQFEDKLGQGAYGTVFKGKLSSEVFVAVKVLNNSEKGDGEEFINEVGTMGHIHHVNVVRMVGFCAEGFRRALVYEFFPNGSLQDFISSADNKNSFLGWDKLKDISLGIAKGIEYLHQGCDQRILHFDIKPQNVLLDQNFTPKISDFGMSKLCAKDQSIVSMTMARGTIGYIAPEVFSRNFGNVSYKSDVYSFGMLLLEIVGGRKNIGETMDNSGEVYYPEWIHNLLDEGEDLRVHIGEEGSRIDSRIPKELAIVGLWCIQWHPMNRPSMKSVVQMLGGRENLTMPPTPFASTGPTRTNATSRPAARRFNLDLEAIVELE